MINTRLTSNGKPILAPLVMDHANELPPRIGANALKKKKMHVSSKID